MKLMFIRNRNLLNTKWIVQYINALRKSRPDYEITVVSDTYKKLGNELTFDDGIRLINLSGKTSNPLVNVYHRIRCKLIPGWFRHKKLIQKEKPDVIICYFPTDLFNVTMCQKHNIPIIMMLHNHPAVLLAKYTNLPATELSASIHKEFWPLRQLHRGCFEQISVYQTLLASFNDQIPADLPARKTFNIPNMVQQHRPEEFADLTVEKKKIVYVARVERDVKRQHFLVEAFSRIAKDFPAWTVEFWGLHKYPDYDDAIMAIAKHHHIEDRVFIRGYTTNITEVYQNADIHAFPSKYEGFGLGLADGQALGLPSVGFSDAPAVNELIKDGHNGFLADNIEDFACKMAELMRNQDLRIKFGKNAVEDVRQYSPEAVIARWNRLIDETVKGIK